MKDSIRRVVESRIEEGYSFPIGQYLREGWAIYKAYAGGFIGFLFLSIIINFFAGLIPVLGFLAVTFIISPALQAGYFIVSDKIARGEILSFNSFFRGFDYVGGLAIMALLMLLIIALIFTPTLFALADTGLFEWYRQIMQNPFDPGVPEPPVPDTRSLIIMLLNLVPLLYILTSYLWAPMFIVFANAGPWDALESSRRLITRQWFSVFGMLLSIFLAVMLLYLAAIVLTLIVPVAGILAAILLGITFVLLAPAFYCVLYAAFADVTGLLGEEEMEEGIEEHLVD